MEKNELELCLYQVNFSPKPIHVQSHNFSCSHSYDSEDLPGFQAVF
jgi:hypothetical protein